MSEYLQRSKAYKGYHYSVLKPEMLDYLHRRTLEMWRVVAGLLEENHIRYMICGGTLLGAVTTGHFIPWDDDVDVCVLEDDYDQMIDVLTRKLPKDMQLQWKTTEPNYYHGWVKIRDVNSHVYPDCASYANNGVWIDMYKLTRAKRAEVKYLIAKEHLDYLERRRDVGDITDVEMNRRISVNHLNRRAYLAWLHKTMLPLSEPVYVIWSASKIVLDRNWCFPLKNVMLEGGGYMTFHEPEKYLERHYGSNFRSLPPDELRRVGLNRIDFQQASVCRCNLDGD